MARHAEEMSAMHAQFETQKKKGAEKMRTMQAGFEEEKSARAARLGGQQMGGRKKNPHPSSVAPLSLPTFVSSTAANDPRSPTARRTPLPTGNAAPALYNDGAAKVCGLVATAYRRRLTEVWARLCFAAFPLSISSRTSNALIAPLRQKHRLDGVIVGRAPAVLAGDGSNDHLNLAALRPHTRLHAPARPKRKRRRKAGGWFFRNSLLGQKKLGKGNRRGSASLSAPYRPRPPTKGKSSLHRRLS
jgi:hypothetical protein